MVVSTCTRASIISGAATATVSLSICRTGATNFCGPTGEGTLRCPIGTRRAGSSAAATGRGRVAGATRAKVSRPTFCTAAICRPASTITGPATPAVAVTAVSLGVSAISSYGSGLVAGGAAAEGAGRGRSTGRLTATVGARTGRTGLASTTGTVVSSTSRRPTSIRPGTFSAVITVSAGGPSVAGATFLGRPEGRGGPRGPAGTGSGASGTRGLVIFVSATIPTTVIFRAGRVTPTGTSVFIILVTVSGGGRSTVSSVITGRGGRATRHAVARAPTAWAVGALASTATCTVTGAGSAGSSRRPTAVYGATP